MPVLINDEIEADAMVQRRRQMGLDRYDEVWDGVYFVSPNPNNEHQSLVGELTIAIGIAIKQSGRGITLPGANVSDRDDDWKQNYRVPDLLVFLNGCTAENRGTHWFGGPDFAIEITSPKDRTLEKLDFYAKVGTKELLIIDRHPWKLSLYQLQSETMVSVAVCSENDRRDIDSDVLGLQFELDAEASVIRVTNEQISTYEIPIELRER